MLELLFPFLGSVFITLLLRRLDKSNVNMKKIKNLIERGERDLSDIVLRKKEELKDKTSEFNLLIFDLDKYISKLKIETQDTKQSLKEIHDSKAKFKDIEFEINSINQITQSVQSQLLFIKDFVSKVDSNYKKVKKIEDRLQDVDEQVNSLLLTFRDNMEDKARDIRFLLEDRLKSFETGFEGYQRQIKDGVLQRCSNMDEDVQRKLQDIESKLKLDAEVISNEISQHLKLGTDHIHNLENKVIILKNQIDVVIPKNISDFYSEVSKQSNELSNSISQLNTEIAGIDNHYKNKYTTLLQDLENQKKLLFDNLLEKAAQIRDSVQRLDLDAIAKKDELIEALRKEASEVENKLEQFNRAYQQNKTQLFEDATKYYADISERIEQFHEGKYSTTLKEFERRSNIVDTMMERLYDDCSQYEQKFNEIAKHTQSRYQEIITDIEGARDYLHKEIITSKEHVSTQLKTIDSSFEDSFQKYIVLFNTKTDSLPHVFEKYEDVLSEKIKDVSNFIDSSVNQYTHNMKDTANSYKQQLLEYCQQMNDEFERVYVNSIKSINEKESNIIAITTDTKDSMSKMKLDSISNFKLSEERFKDQFNSYLSTLNTNVANASIIVKDNLSDAILILKDTANDINKDVLLKTDTFISKLEKQYKEYFDSLKDKINKFNDSYTTDTNKAFEYIEHKEKSIHSFIEGSESRIENLFLNTKELIQNGKIDIEKGLSQMSETHRNKLVEIQDFILVNKENMGHLIKNYQDTIKIEFNTVKNLLSEQGDDWGSKFEKQYNDYFTILKDRIDKFSSIYADDTAKLLKQLEEKESDFRTFAETWESRLESLAIETKDAVHKGKLDLDKQRIEVLETNSRALTDIFEKYKQQTEQRITNLYDLKRDLESKQNSIIEDMRKQKVVFEGDLKILSQEQLHSFEELAKEKGDKIAKDIKDLSIKSVEVIRKDADTAFQKFTEYQREQESTLNDLQVNTQRAEDEIHILQKTIQKVKDETNILEEARDRIQETKEVMFDLTKKMDMVHAKNKELKELSIRMDDLKEVRLKLDAELSLIAGKEVKMNQVHDKLSLMAKVKDELDERTHSLVELKSLVDRLLSDEDKLVTQQHKLNTLLDDFTNYQGMILSTTNSIKEQDINIKNTQESVQATDQFLKKLDIKSQNIASQMQTISTQLLGLEKNESEIEFIRQKFLEIEDLMEDIDRKKEQIESIRHKYENLRTSMTTDLTQMEKIEQNAEQKVKKLAEFITAVHVPSNDPQSTFTKNVIGKSSTTVNKDAIINLGNMGWSADEIANRMKIDIATIQTILSTVPGYRPNMR